VNSNLVLGEPAKAEQQLATLEDPAPKPTTSSVPSKNRPKSGISGSIHTAQQKAPIYGRI
jgi:hypothetical protein